MGEGRERCSRRSSPLSVLAPPPWRCASTARARSAKWEPDGWEKWKGVQLQPGESRIADGRAWTNAHAGDFIVVGANTAASDPTMMRVVARRPEDGAEAEFLVPKTEYSGREDRPGEFGRAGDDSWSTPPHIAGSRNRGDRARQVSTTGSSEKR